MATEYRCPVTAAECLWTHVDKVDVPVLGWEKWAAYRHSFTRVSMGDHLPAHHLEVEKVLYAHLETHSPHQWMATLRKNNETCFSCGASKRECEACNA